VFAAYQLEINCYKLKYDATAFLILSSVFTIYE